MSMMTGKDFSIDQTHHKISPVKDMSFKKKSMEKYSFEKVDHFEDIIKNFFHAYE
jgi:hypothetical protein